MKRILLLFLVAALVCFTIAQDCPLKSGTPKQLKKCLNQVKYNKAQAKQIIDKLKTIFSVSTLTNLYKSNVAPYFQKVDIIKKLDQVAKKKWKNYFDFFATLQGLISSLNDGHVTLSIPQGYRDYHLIRPYTVNFGIENEDLYGTLQNCMKSCVLCQKKTNATLAAVCDELKPYVGKRVVSINGLTPYKYFLKMADSFGFHPDLGGRFSYFIQDLSDVFMWQHYLKKHADVEKLKFEDGTTVNVPIVANNRRQATSAKIKASIVAYNAALQNAVAKVLGPATSSSSARSIEDEEFIDVHENIQNGPNPGPEFVSATTERDLETETVVNNCVQQATYPLGNTKATLLFCNVATLGETVAVLIFPTFSTEQLDGPNVFKNTINAMRQNSIKRIMIDVSGNGGGFVGLAFVAMTAITGRNPSDFLLPFSMRKTDGLINYINVKTPNTLSRVFDQNGKNYSNPEFAQYATTTFPEDSSSSYFEPFYYFNSPSFQTRQQMYNFVYKLNGSSFSDFPQSPAEEIIVLTDGRCASSCSIFTTGLQVLAARDSTANIRVVQYSGQPNKPFDVSNIACNIITAGTPGFPSMGFKILRVHNSPNTTAGVFRQFTRFNPDYRLELWPSKKNKPLIYSNALQYFGFSQKLQPPRRRR